MAHRWVLGLFVAVSSTTLSVATMLGQDGFPDGPGKPQLIKVCNGCHDAQIVLANLKTPTEWAESLRAMAEQGAEATSDEWRLIQQYLDSNLALVAINKATSDELQRTMGEARQVAEAIVKYRKENGAFKSVDDIKKVPGIDVAKVDARAKRLVF
jgi:competence protein ComEA